MWRKAHESWKSECLQATMKHGGLGIMVLGAIWYEGRSPLILIEKRLHIEEFNKILEIGLLPLYERKLDKSNTLFQEDVSHAGFQRLVKQSML